MSIGIFIVINKILYVILIMYVFIKMFNCGVFFVIKIRIKLMMNKFFISGRVILIVDVIVNNSVVSRLFKKLVVSNFEIVFVYWNDFKIVVMK